MQRVPKKPNVMKSDLQNSTARLNEDNLVLMFMEAGCFLYGKSSMFDLTRVIPIRLATLAQGDDLP